MPDIMITRPFHPIRRMRSELDRFFNEALGDRWGMDGGENGWRMWSPRMDFSETETGYHAKVDLPGLKKDDVTVKVEERQLIVSGERKEEKREEKEDFLSIERHYGSFYRSLPLPENAVADAVDAKIDNGVLTIKIPKSKEAKAKVIKVK